ncbi:MAG: hypothetical protein K2W96_08220 [Gemmataceae bacterium]|nr:hypothetical protein [Gemmataceae bacterium]
MIRLLAAAAVLAVLPSARADRLDSRLLEESPKLADKIASRGWANVGVLRFKVEAPGQEAGYSAPLSGSMAARVETGLVLFAERDGKPRFGVLREPGEETHREKLGELIGGKIA